MLEKAESVHCHLLLFLLLFYHYYYYYYFIFFLWLRICSVTNYENFSFI